MSVICHVQPAVRFRDGLRFTCEVLCEIGVRSVPKKNAVCVLFLFGKEVPASDPGWFAGRRLGLRWDLVLRLALAAAGPHCQQQQKKGDADDTAHAAKTTATARPRPASRRRACRPTAA